MKQVKRRAYAALILAVALLAGLGLYAFRFAAHAREWVTFSANQNVYRAGRLTGGTVLDRSGVLLAGVSDGARVFADDQATRAACLHAVGDAEGNIGTGALTTFADRLSGYDLISGASDSAATVSLSISAELNRIAWNQFVALGSKGAVLVSDYTTGEILCMVSSPSYDPNTGFDLTDSWYDSVWLNRALSAAYTPGSVFKLVTLAAAVENIDDLYDRTFTCTGSTLVDGNTITCTGVHGEQTVEQALAVSCNCAFAELSLELGGRTLLDYAERLGFTGQLSPSGVYTAQGKFDSAPDGSADLAWSGIGQSTDLVCPAALLRYVSAIANGGTAVGPVLLKGEHAGRTRLLSEGTAEALKDMMSYNVAYSYGTGNFPGLSLCAKTGTAEVGDGTSHAWFTGFLDDPAHPYAFVVIVENGGSGLRTAGPVANAVLQAAVNGDNA